MNRQAGTFDRFLDAFDQAIDVLSESRIREGDRVAAAQGRKLSA